MSCLAPLGFLALVPVGIFVVGGVVGGILAGVALFAALDTIC